MSSRYIFRKVTLEFLVNLVSAANVANLDPAQTTFGLDSAAFGIDADGVSLNVSVGLGATKIGNSHLSGGLWTNIFNKFRIELTELHTKFWVNDTLAMDLSYPNQALPINTTPSFDFYTLAAGAASIYIGRNRIWCDDRP